ncbi:hypothetical protein J2Z51_000109 [Enterococcus alcedinis]|nr:hypothetical protein [Enterococcus alcedinis]
MMQSFNRMTDYIERHLNDELTEELVHNRAHSFSYR